MIISQDRGSASYSNKFNQLDIVNDPDPPKRFGGRVSSTILNNQDTLPSPMSASVRIADPSRTSRHVSNVRIAVILASGSQTVVKPTRMVRFVPISDIVRSVCIEKDTEPLLPSSHGAMSSMSKRLVNLIRCIFRLLAFASPRAAGIILSSRAASAAIIGT